MSHEINSNNNREIAIDIQHISKKYRLGLIGGRTLQEELESWWAKKRGREDPNVKIGFDQRLIGQTFWALRDVNLTIYKGERIGIIGMNGAGKSTLLKLISRVTAPTEGDILLYGRVSSMLEVGTGFHGEMTGRENIYMNGAILGMKKVEIDQKIEDIIEFSEVREFIDTPVKRYSSGMFVKLAFSVAAHLNSEIMIMDEVLAVGDYAFQQKCMEKMKETAADQGRTILYVSHNMETIRNLCNRCVVLKEGQIIFDGDVEEAIALYLGKADQEEAGTNIDLRNKKHLGGGNAAAVVMEELSFDRYISEKYKDHEPLNMTISLKVNIPGIPLKAKLGMSSIGNFYLGSSWSEEFTFGETGQHYLHMSFPMDFIGRGKFSISIGIYAKSDSDKFTTVDSIKDAFYMNVKGDSDWSLGINGHLRLPKLELKSEFLI